MKANYVILLKDQILGEKLSAGCRQNATAIMNYENSVLAVSRNPFELLFTYPQEKDAGIYVVAVNGRIVAANNKRAICNYLATFDNFLDIEILVHKLGTHLDLQLHNKLKGYALV